MFEDQNNNAGIPSQLSDDANQAPVQPENTVPMTDASSDMGTIQQVPSSSTTSFSQVQPMQNPRDFTSANPLVSADIKTMPDRFIPGKTMSGAGAKAPSSSGKRLLIIVGIVAVVMGGITAGVYFFLNSPLSPFGQPDTGQLGNTNEVANTNQVATTTPENLNTNTTTTEDAAVIAARDRQRLTDLTTIAKELEDYRSRYGAYPQFLSLMPQDIAASIPVDPLSQRQYAYTPTNDRQSYILVFDVEKEVDFKGQSLTTGPWELYPKNFNENANDNQNQNTNTNVNSNTNTSQLPNLDSDGDGLTAAEETLFKTSFDLADTDSDGFTDGVEIRNFYSPLVTGSVKLDAAGLVKLYTSTSPAYSFYYPADWIVNAVNGDVKDVLVTSTSGENFSFSIKDNSEKLSSWDWYVKNVSGTSDKNSVSIVRVAGKDAVKTLDGLSVYIASGSSVYVVKYNLNNISTINYPSIFNLLLDRLVIS